MRQLDSLAINSNEWLEVHFKMDVQNTQETRYHNGGSATYTSISKFTWTDSSTVSNDWTSFIEVGTNYCALYSLFEVDSDTVGSVFITDDSSGGFDYETTLIYFSLVDGTFEGTYFIDYNMYEPSDTFPNLMYGSYLSGTSLFVYGFSYRSLVNGVNNAFKLGTVFKIEVTDPTSRNGCAFFEVSNNLDSSFDYSEPALTMNYVDIVTHQTSDVTGSYSPTEDIHLSYTAVYGTRLLIFQYEFCHDMYTLTLDSSTSLSLNYQLGDAPLINTLLIREIEEWENLCSNSWQDTSDRLILYTKNALGQVTYYNSAGMLFEEDGTTVSLFT
jgi:hypothetical protein